MKTVELQSKPRSFLHQTRPFVTCLFILLHLRLSLRWRGFGGGCSIKRRSHKVLSHHKLSEESVKGTEHGIHVVEIKDDKQYKRLWNFLERDFWMFERSFMRFMIYNCERFYLYRDLKETVLKRRKRKEFEWLSSRIYFQVVSWTRETPRSAPYVRFIAFKYVCPFTRLKIMNICRLMSPGSDTRGIESFTSNSFFTFRL